jgi:hypothetical protein
MTMRLFRPLAAAGLAASLMASPVAAVVCSAECARPAPSHATQTDRPCHAGASSGSTASISAVPHDCSEHAARLAAIVRGHKLVRSERPVSPAGLAPGGSRASPGAHAASLEHPSPRGLATARSTASLPLRI